MCDEREKKEISFGVAPFEKKIVVIMIFVLSVRMKTYEKDTYCGRRTSQSSLLLGEIIDCLNPRTFLYKELQRIFGTSSSYVSFLQNSSSGTSYFSSITKKVAENRYTSFLVLQGSTVAYTYKHTHIHTDSLWRLWWSALTYYKKLH